MKKSYLLLATAHIMHHTVHLNTINHDFQKKCTIYMQVFVVAVQLVQVIIIITLITIKQS